MKENIQENIKDFKNYIRKMEYLSSAIAVLYWDSRTKIPKKGLDYRCEVIGYLSTEAYKLGTSDMVGEYIKYFRGIDNLDTITKSMVENAAREYEKTKKIPENKFTEYVLLQSTSEAKWEEAKKESDFSIFKPYLKKMVETIREFTEYWGYEGNRFNPLLDQYEPGITVEKLDVVFGELRNAIVELLKKIKASNNQPDTSFLIGNFPKEKQERLGRYIVDKLGYDLDAGRVDESVHPFTISFGNKDVRITTNYHEDNILSALFSYIHEGGHAIYEQNIPDELAGTGLAGAASMGLHESQSRFYENILGRSREFWSCFYPKLQEIFPQFNDVSLDEFYRGINFVKPSLVRLNADELTYSLHIIIRYEIEKALINGEIAVEDLPRIWNEKYKEYLGVEPENDAEGVLQDMHWSDGSFGYFPSYALGNLYGAQFFNKMKKDIPDVEERMANGEFSVIKNWLKENIHGHGAIYKPSELIKMVTGEELTAKYFIEYLNKKYSEIYNL